MDCTPDTAEIKLENNELHEHTNDDLEYCFDVHVKVEKGTESLTESVLTPNEIYQDSIHYEEFEQDNFQIYLPRNNTILKYEDYQDKVSYAPNVKYQENINYMELNDDFQIPIQKIPYEKYKEKIIYEEVNEGFPICMLCGKYFYDSNSLLKHNLCHLKVPLIKRKLFMCEHCPKYCKKKEDIKNHILIAHVRQYNSKIPVTKQLHKCLICNKTYSYSNFVGHMKEVHSEVKFKCKECNLMFNCKRYLTRHNIKYHSGVQRKVSYYYKKKRVKQNCPKCPAILDSKNALVTHLRNCHSEERYKCSICHSILKCKSYLLTHMRRVHLNDGVIHKCDICGKEFKSTRYVKIHKKNSHMKK